MERDPSSEANIGYAIPDKDECFGDAERIAVRRPAPLASRGKRRRWVGGLAL